MNDNIDYWEKVLISPTPVYQKLFDAEKEYLWSNVTKDANVLDIGCGNGRVIKLILDKTKTVTGIDNDPNAVKDAKINLIDFPTVKIVQSDIGQTPFSDEFFDYVTLIDTLVNFNKNKIKALSEIRRILRNDGKIIISVYSEDAFAARKEMYQKVGVPVSQIEGTTFILSGNIISEQFSEQDLEIMAKSAGLKIVDCKKIEGIAYLAEMMKS